MSTPVPTDPDSDPATTPVSAETPPAAHGDHLDPITGEPHAHPVGVGVGALSAGVAGAAIGAVVGPIGVLVGATIGAIVGGLAGHEAADKSEVSPTSEDSAPLDEFDHASASAASDEVPLSPALAERTNPADDEFFTGGTVRGHAPATSEPPLDDFDRPRADTPIAQTAATPITTAPASGIFQDDKPLPTASSGLVTPDESSFFADSTTGESSMMTESPLPAARAVNAEGTGEMAVESANPADHSFALPSEPIGKAMDSSAYVEHSGAEHTIRTGAYYRYLDREATGQAGSDFEDWIEAEKEVLNR